MAVPFLTKVLAWAAFVVPPGDAPPPIVRPANPLVKLAGEYHWSTGFVDKCLTITADGRFAFAEEGCVNVYNRHEGRAEVVNGRLVLKPRKLNLPRTAICLRLLGEDLLFGDEKGKELRRTAADFASWNHPTEFIPVRWGARLFLVPWDEGPEFCDCVLRGFESVNFYYRDDAPGLKAEGLPKVPKEWEPMLLKGPLRGKLIDVLSPFMARVDFGSASGAWKGMKVRIEGEESSACKVVSVDATTCLIERVYPSDVRFKVGQGVRTRVADGD